MVVVIAMVYTVHTCQSENCLPHAEGFGDLLASFGQPSCLPEGEGVSQQLVQRAMASPHCYYYYCGNQTYDSDVSGKEEMDRERGEVLKSS